MNLSRELVSQFVKITKDDKKTKSETTNYGTVVKYNDRTYVKLDGSDLLTPVSTTTDTQDGERVTVMIKNHAAIITGNISSPSARTDDVQELDAEVEVIGTKISEFEIVVADKVSTIELEAERARIDQLVADDVVIRESLTAHEAVIEELKATNATISGTLNAHQAFIDKADITYATIENLKATDAQVGNLNADVADINTLIFGSATGTSIQTSFANAVIAQLGDAQIKAAMIESLAASQITAGTINSNKVSIQSEDGSLIISDETIQIKDDTRVRVQIGKDAANDYSINIWDAEGNLMFSEGGITDSAIKDAIIRDDMVSETANISAAKLNIQSLFEEINGSEHTIKSTQIYLDDVSQTLDVAFKTMETDVSELGETVTTHGTQITAVQGQIASKIWQQDIDDAASEMSDKYSTLEQDLTSFKTSVGTSTTDLSNRVTSAETTISQHTADIALKAEQADVDALLGRVSSAETAIALNTELIELRATKNEITSVLEGYYTSKETDGKLSVTSEKIDMQFNTAITQTNAVGDALTTFKTQYSKHISFSGENAITIGSGDGAITLTIDNDNGIVFSKNGVRFGYWDGVDFHTGNIVVDVKERAQFGNYAFVPRSDGSLMLLKVGG